MKILRVLAAVSLFTLLVFVPKNAAQYRKVDSFGFLNRQDVSVRLQSLVIELNADPQTVALITTYGGRDTSAGDVSRMNKWIKTLLAAGKISENRLLFQDGGFRDEALIDLWLGRRDDAAPYAEPTVAANEVASKPQTRMVDFIETLPPKLGDLRLDLFAEEVKDAGENAKAYFVLRAGGSPKQNADRGWADGMKSDLVTSKRIPRENVFVVDSAAAADRPRIEMWLAPPGQPLPDLGGADKKPSGASGKPKRKVRSKK